MEAKKFTLEVFLFALESALHSMKKIHFMLLCCKYTADFNASNYNNNKQDREFICISMRHQNQSNYISSASQVCVLLELSEKAQKLHINVGVCKSKCHPKRSLWIATGNEISWTMPSANSKLPVEFHAATECTSETKRVKMSFRERERAQSKQRVQIIGDGPAALH